MKKALLLSTLLFAGAANADFLGVTAEAGAFSPDVSNAKYATHGNVSSPMDLDGKTGAYFGIALDHPIPLIPNIRLQHVSLKADGSMGSAPAKLDLSNTDYTLYYRFLDGLFWLDFDAGVSLRKIDGSATISGSKHDLSDTQPLGYVSAFVTLPGTSLSFGGEVKAGGYGGTSITDTTLKVKYETPFFVGLEGGYRAISMDLNDIDNRDVKADFKGAFIGAFVHF